MILDFDQIRMAITWREIEHEKQDMVALNDPCIVEALKDCGLLKYFRLSKVRQQLELLQFLVHSWDPTEQVFHIGDKVLPILIDDIYFLTGLSRCGALISLSGSAYGDESMRDYI